MFKKIKSLATRHASLVASALVLVATVGVGVRCWLVAYQPEPPKMLK